MRRRCLVWLWLLICLPLVLPGFGWCGDRDYATTGVTVAASDSWKPYSYLDENDEPAGFLIDYWKKWSEKMDIPVHFRLLSWAESLTLVANGECDIHSGLYSTPERARYLLFSESFFHNRAVVVTREDIPCTTDRENLRWGAIAASVEYDYVRKLYPRVELSSFKNSPQMYGAMALGEIDIVLDDWSKVMLVAKPMDIGVNTCETAYRRDLHAGVAITRPELLKLVDDGLALISPEERRYLTNTWFIESGNHAFLTDTVGPVVIAVLLSFVIWVWALRRRGE